MKAYGKRAFAGYTASSGAFARFGAARLMLLAIVCALALGLAACGGGGASGAGAAPDGTFAGRTPRDITEISTYMDKAIELAATLKADDESDEAAEEEGELAASVAQDFKDANSSYSQGDYARAEEGYRAVLKKYPGHFGANSNLVLALLQQGKNDDALTQALACTYAFPDEGGPILNTQVAGVACGFSVRDLEEAITTIRSEDGLTDVDDALEMGNVKGDYEYNQLWDDIDVDLGRALSDGSGGDKATLASLIEGVWALSDRRAGDADAEALRAYLAAVAVQLGYPIDPDEDEQAAFAALDKAEAADSGSGAAAESSTAASGSAAKTDAVFKEGTATSNTIPFLVTDNELFSLEIVDSTIENGYSRVVYVLSNKDGSGYTMYADQDDEWTVNGKTVTAAGGSSATVKPGENAIAELKFKEKGSALEVRISSFEGKILIRSSDGKGIDGEGGIGSYLLKYDGK